MEKIGDVIRRLMEARKISGLQLASDIGITPTSISRILTGQSRPRQVTMSRLMKRLCETREEEQTVLRAYSSISEIMPEEPSLDSIENAQSEIARCLRFLEIKTQSICFKNAVGKELAKANFAPKPDYCEGMISTDFLIEDTGKRIALECKFNIHRDLDKTLTTAEIIRDRLRCDHVLIVTPFVDDSMATRKMPDHVLFAEIASIAATLSTL
jgi:transcriptional regulator with XRE-family HTH domain